MLPSRTDTSRTLTDLLPDQCRRKPCARHRLPAISLDIVTESESAVLITVHAWQLPVTESLHSGTQKFDLREWLVGPILVSISLGLMIAGAVIIRWYGLT